MEDLTGDSLLSLLVCAGFVSAVDFRGGGGEQAASKDDRNYIDW